MEDSSPPIRPKRSVVFALGWSIPIKHLIQPSACVLETGAHVQYPYERFEVPNTEAGLQEAKEKMIAHVEEWVDSVRKMTTLEPGMWPGHYRIVQVEEWAP
jgi:hypothetical protein